MAKQLALGVSWRDDATFDNYCFGDQMPIARALQAKYSEPFIYLWGKPGVGCSHLLQACCFAASEKGQSAVYLPLRELPVLDVAMFDGLENLSLVCIDDLDVIVGNRAYEEALFHCFNRLRAHGTCLRIAAHTSPNALGLALADLRSRLLWGLLFHVLELSDTDKIKALSQKAASRGLDLSFDVASFLLKRCQRDMPALSLMLDKLDYASLAEQRRLTIPFVKHVLLAGADGA